MTANRVTANRVRQLDSAVAAAAMHCLLTQQDNGSWTGRAVPRTAETAMACFALSWAGDMNTRGTVARSRAWLFGRPVRHDGETLAETVDSVLWSLAVDDGAPIDLSAARALAIHPEESRLLDVVQMLALYGDRPIQGGRTLQDLRRSFQEAYQETTPNRPTSRSRVESLAMAVLLDMPLSEDEPAWQAVDRLISAQSPDGSFAGDVMTTALGLLALGAAAKDSDAWRRCRDHLVAAQHADGVWLREPSDVLETALTLRAFRADPAFAGHALPTAASFLRASQNTDGGWPARRGDESDTGVTALVLVALAGVIVPDRIVTRAFAFIESRQTAAGLWPAGASTAAPPCEETVAHVVAALRRYPQAHTVAYERARAWLREKDQALPAPATEQRDGRFLGLPYATFRTADALGWIAPESQAAARALAQLQNFDGGWPLRPGGDSTPAATGLALAVLEQAGVLDERRWADGLDYLLTAHREDGRWEGGRETVDPRPLPTCSQAVVQAFAGQGLYAIQRHVHATTPV
ncbi:prenyltransferase/squalene oxidase repeat-containing protein [Streptomyces sp. NPDC048629]|uniref:prenyltransferase/squalene oxidase repeat-containing protein n=1 Tax=Streptomyces sp. NPDC048629 TaxID=3154824 RepID=UPI003448204C